MNNTKEILDKFSKVKIAVIGDIMLDSYIYGSVDRVSPEAPVPIVKVEKEIYELGGAGNVAANIASLGGKVSLFGYVGKDNAKSILIRLLNEKGINHNLDDSLKQTIQKTRVIGNEQHQITRIDKEDYIQIPQRLQESLAKKISEKNPDIIIISDYAKGCLNFNLLRLIRQYNPKIRIIIDTKPKNKAIYNGAYLITPNLKEAKEMTGLTSIEEIGKALTKQYNSNVLITLGKEGMSLFEEDKVLNFPTQAKEVYDVTGAGDTVIAVMGLGLASGLNLESSAYLANHAAGIVVGKAGTATVSINELKQVIESENRKIKTLKELKSIREDCKRKGKKVIWTNGCFDILHVGHVDYLTQAKNLGDCLFVGLNSDSSIKKLKGKDRPINTEEYRAKILSSLEFVDYVVIFKELTAEHCLKELKPDVYAKAGDYNLNTINQPEKKFVESYGGEIKIIPMVYNISTTRIIEKMKGKH